ncbi:P-loop containing nucleoside triphosphate hydrolase protein [Chiua virens]|nr:P-loop containing nucleoside triphosphate hydrolase protein [Chiua virens]
MDFDLSVQFMNGLGSTVLAYLLRTSDVGGDTLDNLLFHVVEPPIFWGVFVHSFQEGALNEDAQLVFARLLSRLLTLQNQDTTPYRNIAAQPSVQDTLVTSSSQELREAGHLIKHILSSTGLVTVSGILTSAGGRHDNDLVDYREIAILPTADEVLCKKPPFLRATLHEELSTSETPIEDYLENTFRMLREDMLFEIREEVEVSLQKKGKRRGPGVMHDVSMDGIYTGTDDRKIRWGVELQCSDEFKQLRSMNDEAARVNFLTRDPRGSKILRHQSLVCLVSGEGIVSFGTVNRVEELLARKPPVIVVQLDGAVNISKTLTALRTGKVVQLIQIDAATFSFEPVLSALKKMSSTSLTEEIILWNPEVPTRAPRNAAALSHIAKVVTSNLSADLKGLLNLQTSIRLDNSQARSLIAGLTKRVSLIQGPPGTGKSFIGTILAKAIHDSTSETILVVCYTNHALDQFLGDLLKYDIPGDSIVRLGGRSNESIEHLTLRNQSRPRVRYDWSTINAFKADSSKHERKLRAHFGELLHVNDTILMNYLKREYDDIFQAFYVPPTTEDGMTLVGEGGRAIDEDYLFSRWTRGLDAGVLRSEPHVQASGSWIWSMDHSARQESLARWRQELTAKAVESICQAGLAYNKAQDGVKEGLGKSTVEILRRKRVIACTTTGAAIHSEAIKEVGPNFLLVEEAGEILEAHVLTSLSEQVDQMILIGDHKQLRPKVNNYQLTVEKGDGFELNRSLFERLVLKGYPHETLSTQHRMRPEISSFVRELTYPELMDAPSTRERANIRGVQSNVIFVNHTHPEDDDSLIRDRGDGGAKTSKQNTYEVQMVLKIVRYLAQQGYKSENLVVLTPYLGQLNHLRNALKHDNDPILNDLDSLELAHAGLAPAAPRDLKAKKSRIHLATIDNYQGEESDIVIASLTRSNKSNANWLHGLSRTSQCPPLTRPRLPNINRQLPIHFCVPRKEEHSGNGSSHTSKRANIFSRGSRSSASSIPNGTFYSRAQAISTSIVRMVDARSLCGVTLSCGHVCPMKCHPLSALHDPSRCKHEMRARCQADRHTITWECRADRPSSCSACVKEAERLEKIAREKREAEKQREEAEAEHRRQMVELEAKLEAEKAAEQRRIEEEHQLSAEASRQEQELSAAKKREELIAERLREDARAAAVARASEYEAERTRMARESEREMERWRLRQDALRRIEQRQAEESEAETKRQEEHLAAMKRREKPIAERKREDAQAAAVARAREYEERTRMAEESAREEERLRLEQKAVRRLRRAEREAEKKHQEELLKRREEMIAEREREVVRAEAAARARACVTEETGKAKGSESSSCTIQ